MYCIRGLIWTSTDVSVFTDDSPFQCKRIETLIVFWCCASYTAPRGVTLLWYYFISYIANKWSTHASAFDCMSMHALRHRVIVILSATHNRIKHLMTSVQTIYTACFYLTCKQNLFERPLLIFYQNTSKPLKHKFYFYTTYHRHWALA